MRLFLYSALKIELFGINLGDSEHHVGELDDLLLNHVDLSSRELRLTQMTTCISMMFVCRHQPFSFGVVFYMSFEWCLSAVR
jgi:hypothetical protein